MKKHLSTSGFTLIELLVVIAVIGILASVVLTSLNSARSRGTDAKIKSQLSEMRAQAELYTGATTAVTEAACNPAGATLFGTANGGLGNLFDGLTIANPNSACAYAGTTSPSNGGAWAVSVSLSTTNTAWCVDSTGWSSDTSKSGTAYTTPATAVTTGPTCL